MKALLGAPKKFIGIIAIFLLVLLMINLNSRLGEYFRLDSERDKMQTQSANMAMTSVALETQVAYATSQQAVEDWARNEAHMAKPGDVVVIAVTPAAVTPTPEVMVTPEARPIANWEVWWALFFGE